ncbi:unnamed protein product, partial [Gongylonema pulchrum]|uniref:Cytochrome cd1 nitrite reductase n=1 Tax=Gongylonema pulchrum TaxID=637853 RepID=A0A183D079_9BILA
GQTRTVFTALNTTTYDLNECGRPLRGRARLGTDSERPPYQMKMMGGEDVAFGEHPWAVLIRYNSLFLRLFTFYAN